MNRVNVSKFYFPVEITLPKFLTSLKMLVLHRKPCICDHFWCVKCKVLHFYVASWIV